MGRRYVDFGVVGSEGPQRGSEGGQRGVKVTPVQQLTTLVELTEVCKVHPNWPY